MSRKVSIYRFAVAAWVLAVLYLGVVGFSGGITGRTQKSPTAGCTCHNLTPSSNVTATITGPETLAPNETGTYTLTVTGGPLAAAGTNIASSAGTLNIITGAGLQKVGDELTHVSPKASEGAPSVQFRFTLTAPATDGSIILYANGNSVNLSFDNTGDEWNFAAQTTVTVGTTGIDDEALPVRFALEQNYPNPFNPATTIGFTLPSLSPVTLEVFSVSGERVAVLADGVQPAGVHSVSFDAAGLPSGVYLYRLQSNAGVASRKMVILK